MKTCYQLVGVVIALCSLAACNSEQVGYFTFQEYEDGYWGLMDHKGNVLFSDEFENPIEGVSEGVILTKDDEGLYQYYTLGKKPKFIAGGYIDAGDFHDGVAPVVRKNECIAFINKKGDLEFVLKEIEGQHVDWVYEFQDGIGRCQLRDGAYVLIDTKGKVLSESWKGGLSFLRNGLLRLSNDEKEMIIHRKDFMAGKLDKALYVYDKEYSGSSLYNDETIILNRENECVVLNLNNGKIILSIPKDDKVDKIYGFSGKYLLFKNEDGDKRGVMDMKGNVVIRPKYKYLEFMNEKTLICSTNEANYRIIDFKENVLRDNLDAALACSFPEDKVAWMVNVDDESVYLADMKGKAIGKKSYSSDGIRNAYGDDAVMSDFYDVYKLISKLGITEYGAGGVTIRYTKDMLLELDQESSYYEKSISDYMWKKELIFSKKIENLRLSYIALFDDYIARNVVSEHGGQSCWNGDSRLQILAVDIRLIGELAGRGEVIYNGLNEYFTLRCKEYRLSRSKPIYRFSGGQDVQLEYDKEQNAIHLVYAVYGFNDDYFNGTD